jgi:uncharacterized spore protein YtfJ
MKKPAKTVPPAIKLLARLTGARLCFGDAVAAGERTVIPVASLRTAGGGGFGSGPPTAPGEGGGGGGAIDARPVGFIEIGPEGTRFERIDDGRAALRAIAAGSIALLLAGRVLSRRRRPALAGRRSVELARRARRRNRIAPPPASLPATRAPRKRGLLARVVASQRS